ncbi:glycosyl transferase family 41-domain-containing protein [Baffinella frigidus]|nr:glycosyl transferase family 41-domain-containing protein [Cryptophyta sp. CCMP2293]
MFEPWRVRAHGTMGVCALFLLVLCVAPAVVVADDFQTIGNQAMGDFQKGKFQEAYDGFLKLQKIQPDNFELFIAAGQSQQSLGNAQAALEQYNMAATAQGGKGPRAYEPYSRMGDLLNQFGDKVQALDAYKEALRLSPKEVQVLISRGNLHQSSDGYFEAERDFAQAVKLEPGNAAAWSGLGVAWMYLEHANSTGRPVGWDFDSYDEGSIHALRKVLSISPGQMTTLSNLVLAENRVCDWGERAKHQKLMRKALKDAVQKKHSFAPPFHAFEYGYSPKELLINTKWLSYQIEQKVKPMKAGVPANSAEAPDSLERVEGKRLRVAYINGAGFHNGTTTSRCMRSMFGHHDKKSMFVIGLPLSHDDKSPERADIQKVCDGWVEAAALTDEQVAAEISKQQVQILVDTTGYTMKQRTETIALARVPITVSFHGFPGTMGARFIDYLFADRYTFQPEAAAFYREKLAITPYTYLINSHRTARREVLAKGGPTREEAGFQKDDLVFASFNQLYKVEPKVWGTWMGVMKKVPNAKLWMLSFSKAAYKYLEKSAKAHGVDAGRLKFDAKFPTETEFLIKRHADLFLDTPLFNAHTTGGDVLWAGIPVVTLPGENFAQRVAAGLLASAGAGLENTLIARTHDDYAALLLRLAARPNALAKIRSALEAAREAAPLFDTKLLTSHVEQGEKLMWEVYAAGEKPMHVIVHPRV